ncbi:Microsomal glutathione S-transferase 1 [Chytriomyces hyalinus]|uniref:Microsomal glutathione S-transferase 1 n=1 Tax=Chytriomyces confervae TaxID=246404 RepID=A0A507FRL2_9FUNG|nr:Microsomal glutathione S-transferase 1 [Chytriomyces hyalinus]KAJ3265984.1 Microsomal glutathione S-transferase 1 [Chytriomyces hyalinus]KAJ3407533.1 Microsomal glutathione S-transferase 1 [Chytriomyces hyalinus]TPX78038.1 hypothetical protein CcCBS67573_g00694 [Chytriomyces confervae]
MQVHEAIEKVVTPELTIRNPVFRSFALTAGVLGLKMVANNLVVQTLRNMTNNFAYAEDRALFPAFWNALSGGNYTRRTKPEDKPTLPQQSELIPRLNAAAINDAVNVPIFLLLSFTWILVAKPSEETAAKVFGTFVASRLVHVFSFVARVQPFRVLSYLTGAGATGYVAGCLLKAVYYNS